MEANMTEPLNGQPKEEKEKKIEFEISSYKIEIIKGTNTIIFNASKIGDIKGSFFKNEIELNKFGQIDKYFRQFDTIDELYLDISKIKRTELKVEEIENNIKLILIYNIREEKKEFPFILNREKISIDNIVNNLCEKSKEIDILKYENENLKYENENLKDKIAELQFMVSCIYHEKCKPLPWVDTSAWISDSKFNDWKNLNVYSKKYINDLKCIIF